MEQLSKCLLLKYKMYKYKNSNSGDQFNGTLEVISNYPVKALSRIKLSMFFSFKINQLWFLIAYFHSVLTLYIYIFPVPKVYSQSLKYIPSP